MIEIRSMETQDVSQIADLEKVCFNDPWSENSIASELDNPLSCWLVAVNGEQVVGYVGSQTVLDGSDMMNIAVSPDFRRMGIAESLIEALVCLLRQRKSFQLRCLSEQIHRYLNIPSCKRKLLKSHHYATHIFL